MSVDTFKGAPVIVHKGIGVGFFYPLKNYDCPPAITGFGGSVITRMMRGQDIEIVWHYPHRSLVPQIVLCRSCKLGCFAQAEERHIQVQCVHGVWSDGPSRTVEAAQRMGAEVESCNICGRSFRAKMPDWWSVGGRDPTPKEKFFNELVICGKKCRARVHQWQQLY